jgi:hypothetical protein
MLRLSTPTRQAMTLYNYFQTKPAFYKKKIREIFKIPSHAHFFHHQN